jgi:hypothetical protein
LNKKVVVEKRGEELGKTCSICNIFKIYDQFTTRFIDGKNYLFSSCRKCSGKALKTFRKQYPEKRLFWSSKHRASRQKLDFDLKESDIVIPDVCPILGLTLDKSGGKRNDYTPTIDRIDPKMGYVKDNIVICSWRANKIKTNASFEELEKIFYFVKRHRKTNGRTTTTRIYE